MHQIAKQRKGIRVLSGRINPIALYLLSLGATIAAYACYSQYAVPKIEGPPNLIKREVVDQAPREDPTSAMIEQFAWLFPDDAWEIQECKVLKSPQGKILFQDYQRLDNGMIDVFPFTMILASQEDAAGPPTVLRAVKGARLKLDGAPGIGSEGGGRLEQAQLAGQVAIYRPPSSAEKDDSLNILTSNVQIDQQKVFTLEEVDFQFGRNRGRGRNLLIDLVNGAEGPGAGDLSNISGVRKIELVQLNYLRLEPDEGPLRQFQPNVSELEPNKRSVGQLLSGTNQDGDRAPIDVSCDGSFVFDFDSNTAVLNDNVHVRQDDQNGDNLRCERLTLLFDTQKDDLSEQNASANPDRSKGPGGLNLKRMIAVGSPARLNALSRKSALEGERVDYNLATGVVNVEGQNGVLLSSPEFRFAARSFKYVMPKDGSLGPLDATGPGQMTQMQTAEKQQKSFQAHWQTSLTVRSTDEGQQLIQMDGGTQVQLDPVTRIAADHLKFWLWQIAKRDPATGQESTDRDYIPSRLFTEGNVEIESPQVSGTARQLVANWPALGTFPPGTFPPGTFPPGTFPPGITPATPAVTPTTPSNQFELPAEEPNEAPNFEQQQFEQQSNSLSRDSYESNQRVSSNRVSTRGPPLTRFETTAGVHEANPMITGSGQMNPGQKNAGWSTVEPAHARSETETSEPNYLPHESLAAGTYTMRPVNTTMRPFAQQNQVASENTNRRFRFDGDHVDISLGAFDLGSPVVELRIDGNVLVNEVRVAGAGAPLKISGASLHMLPQTGEMFWLAVTGSAGQNAVVDAGDLKLAGPSINLDQQANRLWVDGAGEMSLLGLNSIDVSWLGSMAFDGSKIRIERDVVMASREPTDDGGERRTGSRGQYLDVTLKRPIDFSDPQNGNGAGAVDSNGQATEIEQLVLTNRLPGNNGTRLASHGDANTEPVVIDNRTFDGQGRQTEHLQFIVPNANVVSGGKNLTAHGPGTIINRSKGSSSMTIAAPGVSQQRKTENEITYVQINFDGPFSGNIADNRFRIERNVRTVHGTVHDWETSIDPDRVTALPAGAVKLTCDRIDVDRWQKRDLAEPSNELVAIGNAHIVSDTFEATAESVRYTEANDMMVIEGTPRTDANLWYSPVPGGNRQHIVAGKIQYRPSDQWTHVQGIRSGSFTTDGK